MSKSNPRASFGAKSGGTVTVLETHVLRTSARDAKIAFWVVGLISAVLTAVVASDYMHPILAALLAPVVGYVLGIAVWACVKVWFVLRRIWWWAIEILAGLTLIGGWTLLATHTTLIPRLLVATVVVGVPAAVPAIRRPIIAVGYCVAVRHRLRMCFTQFIVKSRSGSLPLILLAWPTPVGERVWIFLRPGLSEADLTSQLDRLAVACWAREVQVIRPGSNAAFLRVDIKRREVLTDTITTPLVDLIDPLTPARPRSNGTLPTALNLADIPTEVPLVARPAPKSANGKPTAPGSNGAASPDDNEWL